MVDVIGRKRLRCCGYETRLGNKRIHKEAVIWEGEGRTAFHNQMS